MIKTIIAVIIGLILYDFSKKIIKLIFIKKQKNNLEKILNGEAKLPYDKEYWGDL